MPRGAGALDPPKRKAPRPTRTRTPGRPKRFRPIPRSLSGGPGSVYASPASPPFWSAISKA